MHLPNISTASVRGPTLKPLLCRVYGNQMLNTRNSRLLKILRTRTWFAGYDKRVKSSSKLLERLSLEITKDRERKPMSVNIIATGDVGSTDK